VKSTAADAFARELDALRAELAPLRGPEDLRFLRRLAWLAWALLLAGLALSLVGLNPLSPLMMALASGTRWMIVAHHTAHGALDRMPGVPARWTSAGFARGARRWLQWPDWIEVEAWQREHNQLHHAYTNDPTDPDLVERQLQWLRQSGWPVAARRLMVFLLASNWRWLYYAPNTSACMAEATATRAANVPLIDSAPTQRPWNPLTPVGRRLWLRSWLPYGLFQFVALPALLLPFGMMAVWTGLAHAVLAEWCTNLYTFAVIVPNHAGADLLRFDDRSRGKGQWYLRQIAASVNYQTGHPVGDWLQGWLNYQIEHHLWPDLTPRQYAVAAPRVKGLCAQYGVRYHQQPVWQRLARTVRIATGEEDMGRPQPADDDAMLGAWPRTAEST